MWDVMIFMATVIVLLVLIELLNLPGWIGRKLRGEMSKREMEEKIRSLESRVCALESKPPDKT